jgi:hypothetical protein
MVSVTFTNPVQEEKILVISKDGKMIDGETFSEDVEAMQTPLFENEDYLLEIYDCSTGAKIKEERFRISEKQNVLQIDISKAPKPSTLTNQEIIQMIDQMLESKDGLDSVYRNRLAVLVKIIDFDLKARLPYLRGGRLEYLLYRLLYNLEKEGKIDSVVWNGWIKKYGIYQPAPGGKVGKSDIIFHIDDLTIVLEVTTIRDTRMQWTAEGASVPDHILNYQQKTGTREKVIGLFSAPSLHGQLVKNLTQHSKTDKIPILCFPLNELLELLEKSSRKQLKEKIKEESDKVLR